MQHILGITALALTGSKNAFRDYNRLRSMPPLLSWSTSVQTPSIAPTAIGQNFENLFGREIIPQLATKLQILYRVTRHIPHLGDGTLFYNNTVGLVELKNHSKPLPIMDRRRFFDSIMINYKHIQWALLITSKCGVPHFATRGYSTIGKLKIENKIILIGFICDYNSQGIRSLESIVKALGNTEIPDNSPQWTPEELLTKGEMSDSLKSKWGTGNIENFIKPQGVLFM